MDVLNQETHQPLNFVKEGAKIGVVNGAIALLLMYGSYYAGLDSFVTVQFVSVFIPYMIVILIFYGFKLRKENGGYLTFKDGLQFTFMSYVVATVIIALGTFVLFDLIDKNLTQKVFDISVEKTRRVMQGMGLKQDEIDKEIERMGSSQKTGAGNFILGIGSDLIWGFVKSLLVTLIIRREKPVF
jgi:hypothetical protein